MEFFDTIEHEFDFCVVGGGIAGLCAAVAAARSGAKTALMQDRPMLGGNASSEIRMWVCGAHGENNRETGLIEELMLENYYRNPYKNYHIWDSVMLEMAQNEPMLTLFLNCSCMNGEMNGNRLQSITGWQLTTQKFHKIKAKIFADCSGDSVLAPITGAEYRMGREARNEYGESIAPDQADAKTMGMSCLLQAREYTEEREFVPPKWAKKFTAESFPFRAPTLQMDSENFWFLEVGGTSNTIDDTEILRDDLLKIAYGVWDYLKNAPENKEKNKCFDLDWIGILPGKRESRRYIGDYVMTQNDVETEGRFDDIIAYGGWSMDDHNPDGIYGTEPPTIYHPAPSPYGIPYRCVYSKNIENLMFAGRNISVTHSAMSSTRVMATCGTLGQAVGTAAAMAVQKGLMPRDICGYINDLQQKLMRNDCHLPFVAARINELTRKASLVSNMKNAENLRNGQERSSGGADNAAAGEKGCYASYHFDSPQKIHGIRLIFDSDLNRSTLPERERKLNRPMQHNLFLDFGKSYLPKTLMKAFTLELEQTDGTTETISVTDYHQRLYLWVEERTVTSVTARFLETWGNDECRVFSFELLQKE